MTQHTALNAILDENEQEAPSSQQNGQPAGDEHAQRLYEEHAARLRAEADAEANARRLAVAQEQWSEYLGQKEADAAALLARAQQLQGLLAGLGAAGGGSDGAGAVVAAAEMGKLLEELGVAAAEARASAAQLKAETSKRSSSQADLESNGDVEMKRPREDAGDSNDSGEDDPPAATGPEQAAAAGFIGPALPPGAAAAAAAAADQDSFHNSFRERARYIPLRLDMDERRLLRLLEAALNVSEYTDRVDVITWRKKNGRVHAQIRDMCAILCGLVVAQDFRRGQQLISERDFADLRQFFQDCFEVGRRHKIMNPEKMRDTFGKMMYLLQDSADPEIQELLEFKCVRPLRTVYALLEERGALALLDDPALEAATAEIVAAGRPRHEVQRDIKVKERARELLARRFRSRSLSEEEVLRCLYSISDNNSYLLFNRDPVDKMIAYLHAYFTPTHFEPGLSLAIQGGSQGSRLTHSHERQYNYVLQSLTLWREISHEMFKLWYLADADLLAEGNRYHLQNTGQGLNRVQSAPRVGRAMQAILARCQRRIGGWVGSSVVHLGDHNVPNALMFIDKYTQVPRILNPVVLVLDELPKLCRDPQIAAYVQAAFGGVEACRKAILLDFFRHAFDGSGADNFFDAGSCIDGRLTSAWNWCSKIEKKPYYHVFKLAGFAGFDGDFK